MGFWNNLFGQGDTVARSSEDFFTEVFSGEAKFSDLIGAGDIVNVAFSNPALLKVICLQCDLFSLGKIYVYKDGEVQEDDPVLNLFKNPNPFQDQQTWLWGFMFWNMLGNTYCYVDSKVSFEGNLLYLLEPHKIVWPQYLLNMKDKIVLSKDTLNSIQETSIGYKYADGSSTTFKFGNIVHTPDLTNGSGNWFKGNNRVKALRKPVTNSEASLDAKNINIRYAGKFMVAGKSDPDNISQAPMADSEKQDIETKINGRKNVHAVKSMIDIKRFVDNIGALKLDESFLSDYFIIGSMYGIPRDVLEAYRSSTFENQEKARGAHVSYCLQPKGDRYFSGLAKMFGYNKLGKDILIDWEHLSFMQVFAKERAQTNEITVNTFAKLVEYGVPLKEINQFLDTDFSYGKAPIKTTGAGSAQEESK